MRTVVVLATGPSMSQEIADYVKGKATVFAVSDAYKLAPHADAMVSSDAAWWRAHPEAASFLGRKYAASSQNAETKDLVVEKSMGTGVNSGLLAILIAVNQWGAKRVLLCGYDMQGSHYFGPHPAPLKNTSEARYKAFKDQFARYKPKGVQILNCTPNSALRCYPFADLKEQLAL